VHLVGFIIRILYNVFMEARHVLLIWAKGLRPYPCTSFL